MSYAKLAGDIDLIYFPRSNKKTLLSYFFEKKQHCFNKIDTVSIRLKYIIFLDLCK